MLVARLPKATNPKTDSRPPPLDHRHVHRALRGRVRRQARRAAHLAGDPLRGRTAPRPDVAGPGPRRRGEGPGGARQHRLHAARLPVDAQPAHGARMGSSVRAQLSAVDGLRSRDLGARRARALALGARLREPAARPAAGAWRDEGGARPVELRPGHRHRRGSALRRWRLPLRHGGPGTARDTADGHQRDTS